jgi:N-glycosylase/DNA lyase
VVGLNTTAFPAHGYNLDATLSSGQSFRWTPCQGGWDGVIGRQWVRLERREDTLFATTLRPHSDWRWLEDYLQIHADMAAITASFPQDDVMRQAGHVCQGMRLLHQDPWESLACFICSANKQIRQIQQIVGHLCETFGEPVEGANGAGPYAFPTFSRLASASEADLRACKMGFRAPYLLDAARRLDGGLADLERVKGMSLEEARSYLTEFNGVGPKIADCVLLFGFGFPRAFPVDVWIRRAMECLYFKGRRVPPERLDRFITTYFGPWSGHAQQYLFHAVRTGAIPLEARPSKPRPAGRKHKSP